MTNKKEKEFISNPVEAYENVVKKLACKTQECGELKEKNALLESQMAFNLSEMGIRLGNEVNRSETLLKELKRFDKIKDEFREMSEKLKSKNDRYRKAFDEIESIADDYNRIGKTSQYYRDGFEQIFDIINKATSQEEKGEGDV